LSGTAAASWALRNIHNGMVAHCQERKNDKCRQWGEVESMHFHIYKSQQCLSRVSCLKKNNMQTQVNDFQSKEK
jgi:hypothetical protein